MTTQNMKELFKNLGLNQNEIDTYLKLLELWAQPVSILAKHVWVPRSTMYLFIESLKNQWFVEDFKRSWMMYIKAISPESIEDLLKVKKNKIDTNIEMLKSKLPQLKAIENRLNITPKVKFYEWKNQVMKMYETILKEKEFFAFFNPHFVKKIMPEYHFKIPETIKKSWWKVMELLINCPEAIEYKKLYNSKKHQIKILNKNISFTSDTIITKDKIYMISFWENEIAAIEIYNATLANTQKELFNVIWNSY